MGWGSKASNKGSNDYSCVSPESESSHKEDKHGHFNASAKTVNAQKMLAEEGSMGIEVNQGGIDLARIPTMDEGGDINSNSPERLGTKEQGSHINFKS